MVDPELEDTIRRSIKDHEVFLTFNADEDAKDFVEWWYEEGLAYFQDYVRRNR